MENTSGYWNPAKRNGLNVGDSLNLTFVVRGETSLKIKWKSIVHFRSAYKYFQKQEYTAAVADLNNAISLDQNQFFYYLLRAACYLYLEDIERYCKDIYKAYALHPLVKLENVEVVNGESVYIKCGSD